MRLPKRIPTTHPSRKIAAAVLLAAVSAVLALGARHAPRLSFALVKANEVMYDTLYRLRPVEDRTNGSVVIVAVDQKSLDAKYYPFGAPGPSAGLGVGSGGQTTGGSSSLGVPYFSSHSSRASRHLLTASQ